MTKRRLHIRWAIVLAVLTLATWALVSWSHVWLPPTVNVARGLPGVGFGRMHQFEQSVFAGLDALQRLGSDPVPAGTITPPSDTLAALWPPAPLQPVLQDEGLEGEGLWTPLDGDCLSEGKASAIRQTRLRVDPERPDISVVIAAMDLRRLSFRLRAGSQEGGGVQGGIPDAWSPRVVAAFNGGFQTAHGRFGVGVEGRAVVPHQSGAATVATDVAGRVWLGPWPDSGVSDWVDARQNLQLLVDGGKIEPALWLMADGERQKIGHSITRRSGLCVRAPGVLMYFWTKRGTAETLGRAMVAAGCDRGMHLDLNAFHTGFESLDPSRGCASRLDLAMKDHPEGRYLGPQERDFFVILERETASRSPVLRDWPDAAQ